MFTETEHTDRQTELTFRLTDSPTAQERVLALLLDSAGDQVSEVAARSVLGLPKTTMHVAFSSLVGQSIVREERVGRTILYSVSSEDPLVRTLKVALSIRRVQIVIAPVAAKIDLVVLFGSAAHGENRAASDVDILAVTEDVDAVLSELARRQWLQPVVMTSEDHMRLIAEAGTLAREVARGITIKERG